MTLTRFHRANLQSPSASEISHRASIGDESLRKYTMFHLRPLILSLSLCAPAIWAQDMPPAPVTVAPVIERTLTPSVLVVGSTESRRSAPVASEIAGRITTIEVDAGVEVTTKSVIAKLDVATLKLRQARAAAELSLAKARLSELEAGSRSEEISVAQAELQESIARYEEAKRERKRVTALKDSGSVTDTELSTAQASEDAAEALVAQMQAKLDLAKAGTRKEIIDQAKAQVSIRQVEEKQIEDEVRKATINAPFAGVVAERLCEPGQVIMAGTPLARIVQIKPLRVVLPVPEAVIRRMAKGTDLKVRFDALGSSEVTATVEAIVPEASGQARNIPVRLLVKNEDGRLLPGMTARARIPLESGPPELTVPRDALVRTPSGFQVFVVKDGVAQVRRVELIDEAENFAAIRGKISAGELVVTRGNERLRKNQPVVVMPAKPVQGSTKR